MSTKNVSIYDTNLPIIIVNKSDLGERYHKIGRGDEGSVYNYKNQYALKTFYCNEEKLLTKLDKIEAMSSLKDEAFCFPIGLLGFQDLLKSGYYMELIKYDKNKKNFYYLATLKKIKKIIEYIVKADEAIQRIHTKGIAIGDMKEKHILIDLNNNPVFVDTDNYAYMDYGFDLMPVSVLRLKRRYKNPMSLKDIDIFLFSIMALRLLTHNGAFQYTQSDDYLMQLVNNLNVCDEVKDGLKIIFSDSQNKPYIGPILQRINPKQDLLSRK